MSPSNIKLSTCVVIMCLCSSGILAKGWGPASPRPTPEVAKLLEAFRDLRYGMFIHYNMATYTGEQWVKGYVDPARFNPGKNIDTDAWADAAKAAGMKYAVLTTKHVSGFCLWDSQYTTYDIMHPDCPYQKDVVAQFVKSFTSRGLKVGLYYCWRNPGFKDPANKVLPPECDPEKHTMEEQIEFQKKQIAELVEKYPDAFYIWNDALDPNVMPAEDAKAFIRSLGPNIIASGNWWDWGKKGWPYLDLLVTETRHVRARSKVDRYAPAETCMKLGRGGWFNSGAAGTDRAAINNIVAHIVTANSRNANLLLNVGPDKNGNIPPRTVRALAGAGAKWKKIEKILDE